MLTNASPLFHSLSEPFWKMTEWAESIFKPIKKSSSTIGQLACRIALAFSCVFCALPSLATHTTGYLLSGLEISLRHQPYLKHREIKNGSENVFDDKKLSVLTYNINFFGGSLPTWFGGVEPASQRIERLANTILTSKADVVCLQEGFNSHLIRKLFKALDKKQMNYEAYYDLGAHPVKFNSGLVVISRYKVSDVAFKAFEENKGKAINRGYFSGIVNGVQIIATHLDSSDAALRAKSFAVINQHAVTSSKPVVLLGDFNTDRNSGEYKKMFTDQGWLSTDNSKDPTCNEEVLKARRKEILAPQKTEIVDYIAINQKHNHVKFITERPLKLTEDPFTAESDHAPIKAEIAFA